MARRFSNNGSDVDTPPIKSAWGFEENLFSAFSSSLVISLPMLSGYVPS
jgi:hypothetical protein